MLVVLPTTIAGSFPLRAFTHTASITLTVIFTLISSVSGQSASRPLRRCVFFMFGLSLRIRVIAVFSSLDDTVLRSVYPMQIDNIEYNVGELHVS